MGMQKSWKRVHDKIVRGTAVNGTYKCSLGWISSAPNLVAEVGRVGSRTARKLASVRLSRHSRPIKAKAKLRPVFRKSAARSSGPATTGYNSITPASCTR